MVLKFALASARKGIAAVHRRKGRRRAVAALLPMTIVASISGCSTPEYDLLAPVANAADVRQTRTLLAVTTRQIATTTSTGFIFTGESDNRVHFMSLTIFHAAVPHTGDAPCGAPASRSEGGYRSCLVQGGSFAEFMAIAKSAAVPDHGTKPRALVFTHGYNARFDASVVRFAQIIDDTKFQGVPILFNWPSRGLTSAYGYDKDSVNYRRDAMQLEALANSQLSVASTSSRIPRAAG